MGSMTVGEQYRGMRRVLRAESEGESQHGSSEYDPSSDHCVSCVEASTTGDRNSRIEVITKIVVEVHVSTPEHSMDNALEMKYGVYIWSSFGGPLTF